MPNIIQAGYANLAALTNDDVYIIIVPPGPTVIQGVPTNILGIVGTAAWGPVNTPVLIGSPQEALTAFGPVKANKHDIPTAITLASLANAQAFVAVRVASSDVASTVNIVESGGGGGILVTLTAKYTGAQGDNLRAYLSAGSAANTARVTIQMLGTNAPKETYDNLRKDTGAHFQADLVAAITYGQGLARPPSELVTAVAGAGTATPPTSPTTYIFTGGDDGAAFATETAAQAAMIGSTTGGPAGGPTGMYALEGTGCQVFILPGLDDSVDISQWSTAIQFALLNGMYFIAGFAAGRTSAAAITAKNGGGIDSYAIKMIKDWIWWDDTTNQQRRLVPPECIAGGLVAALSPEQSSGNKPLFGFIGTERSVNQLPYTATETSELTIAGIDFITNPIPYGNVFGLRHGLNGSSNPAINGDNYTRMTNFLAASLAGGLGKFVGKIQSIQPNDQTRADARATIDAFLAKLKQSPARGGIGMIDDYVLVLDETNNPPDSIAQGNMNANVAVRYLAIVRFFLVQLQGGQTVVVVTETAPPGAAGLTI